MHKCVIIEWSLLHCYFCGYLCTDTEPVLDLTNFHHNMLLLSRWFIHAEDTKLPAAASVRMGNSPDHHAKITWILGLS
jgi:hypothetical protein